MTAKRKILILFLVLLIAIPLAGTIYAAQNNSDNQQAPAEATQSPDPNQGAGNQQQGNGTGTGTGTGGNRRQQATNQQAAVSTTISALGSVEPNKVAALEFQTTGTVSGVYAAVGDYVNAGEVLADLKSDDQWNTYNQAVLNLESAQIAMQQLKAPPSAEDLATAKANITSAQASYSSTANSTTPAQLQNAQVQYDQSQAQLAALKDARAHMGGTDAQITLQDAQIGAASFNTEIARLQLEQLKNPNNSASLWSASLRIKQAQIALEQLQQGPTQAQIKSAQLAIDRAQTSVLNAETELKKVQLIAPVTGYVTVVNISAGLPTPTTGDALEISDMSSLHMTVPVNELDVARVAEGKDATIKLDALTDLNIPGKIEHVGWLSNTSTDGIVTYDIQVVLNTTDPRVRIGMTGEVTIDTGSANS